MKTRLLPWIWALIAGALLLGHFGKALWVPLQDPDLFWQLWAGEQMLEGQLPRSNGFSFTAPDHPWTHHEPLVGLTYAAVGESGVGVVRALVVGAAGLLLALLATRRKNAWATLIALGWCVALVHFGRSERALSWGNLMLASVMLLTHGAGKGNRWRMLAAAVVVGIWASVHGSFPVGVAVVALRSWRHGLLAAGLTLVNPSGYQLHLLLIQYGVAEGALEFVHAHVPEWRSPPLSEPATWIRVGCALAVGGLCIRDRRWRALALWLPLFALALRHQRFFDILGIALLPTLADALARRLPAAPIGAVWLIFVEAWLVIAAVEFPSEVDQDLYASELLQHVDADARPWTDFQLGSWLGANGKPAFWDSRNDCYPAEILEDGYTIEALQPGWEDVVQRWEIDVVLTRRDTVEEAFTEIGWQPIARQGKTVVLKPAAEPGT